MRRFGELESDVERHDTDLHQLSTDPALTSWFSEPDSATLPTHSFGFVQGTSFFAALINGFIDLFLKSFVQLVAQKTSKLFKKSRFVRDLDIPPIRRSSHHHLPAVRTAAPRTPK
jgi:hypothetical protein